MPVSVTVETILETFETMGLRNTHPRRLIAQKLAQMAATSHEFATDDLWHELQELDPQIGRATVFRAVDVLVQQGMLDRVSFADGTHRYRVCSDTHHHHLTCTQCHRVLEVDACLPNVILSAIAEQTNFAVEGHSIEIFGRCAACRAAP
jgi:Fur family ferric uptake transcriptional regulator